MKYGRGSELFDVASVMLHHVVVSGKAGGAGDDGADVGFVACVEAAVAG